MTALLLLSTGAVLSLIASDLSRSVALPMAVLAALYGGLLIRRERSRPARQLVAPSDTALWRLDGEPMPGLRVGWRGPLLFVRWRESGRPACLVWWPDTLPAAQRRELRLAAPARGNARGAGSMAP